MKKIALLTDRGGRPMRRLTAILFLLIVLAGEGLLRRLA